MIKTAIKHYIIDQVINSCKTNMEPVYDSRFRIYKMNYNTAYMLTFTKGPNIYHTTIYKVYGSEEYSINKTYMTSVSAIGCYVDGNKNLQCIIDVFVKHNTCNDDIFYNLFMKYMGL